MPSKLTARLSRTTQPDPTTAKQRLNATPAKQPGDDADLSAAFPGAPSWNVVSVDKATKAEFFSEKTLKINDMPSGVPGSIQFGLKRDATLRRMAEVRASDEWKDEAHANHRAAVNELHALYDIMLEDQNL